MYYLFVFRSLTATGQGAKILSLSGIRSWIVRSPAGVSSVGCSHALKVGAKSADKAAQLLRGRYGRVYETDGRSVREVRL